MGNKINYSTAEGPVQIKQTALTMILFHISIIYCFKKWAFIHCKYKDSQLNSHLVSGLSPLPIEIYLQENKWCYFTPQIIYTTVDFKTHFLHYEMNYILYLLLSLIKLKLVCRWDKISMQKYTAFVLGWLVLMKLMVHALIHKTHDLTEISCFRCLLLSCALFYWIIWNQMI